MIRNHPTRRVLHLHWTAQAAAIIVLALGLAACSGTSERLHAMRADPGACQPGTFIGTMTGNCPQPVR